MRPESRQFVRRAQLLLLVAILFSLFVLFANPQMMEKLGLMRLEEPRLRMIAISRGVLGLTLIFAVIFAWWRQHWLKEILGFVAVSSSANLVTDLPMIYQLRAEDSTVFSVLLFLSRALIAILAISLYLDFNSAPKDLRISETLFSLRLSNSKKNLE